MVSAWAITYAKDRDPCVVYVEAEEYKPEKPNPYTPWAKYPRAMMAKCAEVYVLRRMF